MLSHLPVICTAFLFPASGQRIHRAQLLLNIRLGFWSPSFTMRPRFLIPAESLKRSRRSNQYSNWLAIGSRQPTFLAALALDMDAVADTAPAVREVMKSLPGFKDIGKRILT